MRREAASYSGSGRRVVQLRADSRVRPGATAGRAAQHAEEGADGHRGPSAQPRGQLLARPAVHPDFAALAAFSVADQDRTAVAVQVAFSQSKHLADAQPGAPEHDHQRT